MKSITVIIPKHQMISIEITIFSGAGSTLPLSLSNMVGCFAVSAVTGSVSGGRVTVVSGMVTVTGSVSVTAAVVCVAGSVSISIVRSAALLIVSDSVPEREVVSVSPEEISLSLPELSVLFVFLPPSYLDKQQSNFLRGHIG